MKAALLLLLLGPASCAGPDGAWRDRDPVVARWYSPEGPTCVTRRDCEPDDFDRCASRRSCRR